MIPKGAYVQVAYAEAWGMWDLSNGHRHSKRDKGRGYLWVFASRAEALAWKKEQSKGLPKGAKLSRPFIIRRPKL